MWPVLDLLPHRILEEIFKRCSFEPCRSNHDIDDPGETGRAFLTMSIRMCKVPSKGMELVLSKTQGKKQHSAPESHHVDPTHERCTWGAYGTASGNLYRSSSRHINYLRMSNSSDQLQHLDNSIRCEHEPRILYDVLSLGSFW